MMIKSELRTSSGRFSKSEIISIPFLIDKLLKAAINPPEIPPAAPVNSLFPTSSPLMPFST